MLAFKPLRGVILQKLDCCRLELRHCHVTELKESMAFSSEVCPLHLPFHGTSNWWKAPQHRWEEFGSLEWIHPNSLELYSLLRADYLTSPIIHHHTSGVREVLLEPEPGFALVEWLFGSFGCIVGIDRALVAARNVLSLPEHKFGQCLEDPPLHYHASSPDICDLQSDAFLTKFVMGSRVSLNQLLLHTLWLRKHFPPDLLPIRLLKGSYQLWFFSCLLGINDCSPDLAPRKHHVTH